MTQQQKGGTIRPFRELRDSGLLWLINKSLLHPRGYALCLHYKDGDTDPSGWDIMGDGTEPWSFSNDPPTDEQREKYGALSQDELFQKVKELLP